MFAPISFSIRLEEDLDAAHVHFLNPAGKELIGENFEIKEVEPTGCGSDIGPEVNAANPEAEAGHLCVYARVMNPFFFAEFPPPVVADPATSEAEPGASRAGAVVAFFTKENASAYGTWAVKAP